SFQGPIITEQAGKLQVRFRYDLLEEPEPPIRNYFTAIKQHILQLKISPGSIFVFDNHRMLHGRTELKAGLESNRFFKRMYAEEV
ncbi:MAG TPA: TauD/TfdA family dioxygenase, partial [Anaerolineae bacterium]|nr:TauD/TfdA family dioxygenase [Anaerolineae bacterium]